MLNNPHKDGFCQLALSAEYYPSSGMVNIAGQAKALLEFTTFLRSVETVLCLLESISEGTQTSAIQLLTHLSVDEAIDKVTIAVNGSTVLICGALYDREVVAENIERFVARGKNLLFPSTHIHLEYYQDHPFLASNSLSLVVTLVE